MICGCVRRPFIVASAKFSRLPFSSAALPSCARIAWLVEVIAFHVRLGNLHSRPAGRGGLRAGASRLYCRTLAVVSRVSLEPPEVNHEKVAPAGTRTGFGRRPGLGRGGTRRTAPTSPRSRATPSGLSTLTSTPRGRPPSSIRPGRRASNSTRTPRATWTSSAKRSASISAKTCTG